ncbi:MAG: CoA pyrophosphatase [Bacteroidia bacterium]|nr:CoA pyrophosphatase [Bacteroidia bacterium]
MNFKDFLILISKIKNIPLPAESSQFKMIPANRMERMDQYKKAMEHAKQSAVLALFYPDDYFQTKFALIQRKAYNGVHSAQISFPGGKVEMDDKNLEHTAIRETHEEIGVNPQLITIIKPLTRVYIPPSNFAVQPFLGVSKKTPSFVLQEEEVDNLLQVSLLDFINDDNVVSKTVSTSYKNDIEVPAFLLNGHIVWGATAMMLSEFISMMRQTSI